MRNPRSAAHALNQTADSSLQCLHTLITFPQHVARPTMCENLSISDKLTRVRDKLNSDKVQLWTSPYYVEGLGPSDSDLQVKTHFPPSQIVVVICNRVFLSPQTLAARYSGSLGMSTAYCLCALTELQSAALENLESRAKFQESGITPSAVLCLHLLFLCCDLNTMNFLTHTHTLSFIISTCVRKSC